MTGSATSVEGGAGAEAGGIMLEDDGAASGRKVREENVVIRIEAV